MTPPKQDGLFYVVQGKGPAVVLNHGLGSSLREWEPVMPTLAQAGFQAIACDLFGHGRSPKPDHPSHYHIQAVYARLVEWIDSLSLEEPFFIGGHSLGGYLSLKYALQYPSRLRGLLLIDPFYSLEQIPRLMQLLPRFLSIGQKILQAVPDALLIEVMKLPFMPSARLPMQARLQQILDTKRTYPEVARLIQTNPSLLPQVDEIQVPSLLVWGGQDRTCNPRSFARLITRLPNAQSYCLPGCGHHPHLEKPEEVTQRILAFLKNPFDGGNHHRTSDQSL